MRLTVGVAAAPALSARSCRLATRSVRTARPGASVREDDGGRARPSIVRTSALTPARTRPRRRSRCSRQPSAVLRPSGRRSRVVPSWARLNGLRAVQTESHQPERPRPRVWEPGEGILRPKPGSSTPRSLLPIILGLGAQFLPRQASPGSPARGGTSLRYVRSQLREVRRARRTGRGRPSSRRPSAGRTLRRLRAIPSGPVALGPSPPPRRPRSAPPRTMRAGPRIGAPLSLTSGSLLCLPMVASEVAPVLGEPASRSLRLLLQARTHPYGY
jgi:hypothetical protein